MHWSESACFLVEALPEVGNQFWKQVGLSVTNSCFKKFEMFDNKKTKNIFFLILSLNICAAIGEGYFKDTLLVFRFSKNGP